MTPHQAKLMLDKIVGQIFGYQNPFTVEQFRQKYAFDVRLPNQISDSTTGELTWAQSVNPTKFITMENAWKRQEVDDWLLPKRPLNSIEDILGAWNEVNYTATERQISAQNVAESDNIYNSENVFRSQDIRRSKNIIFSDGVEDSEYIAAGQRSNTSTYCARLEDSKECSSSFAVSWSQKIVNCLFIHDCGDMFESIF
jgi:hypothetical protein